MERPPKSDEARKADMLERDRQAILGRATYQGKTYYLVGVGSGQRGPWARLMFRDGSKTFFANRSEVTIVTEYREPRSLASLQEYARTAKVRRENGESDCWACRKYCTCGTSFCLHHHDGCETCGEER